MLKFYALTLALIIVMLWSGPGASSTCTAKTIVVVYTEKSRIFRLFRHEIQLSELSHTITFAHSSTLNNKRGNANEGNIYIAIGKKSLQLVIKYRPHSTTLSVFNSYDSFNKISDISSRPVAAIYIDPDPRKLAVLSGLFFPQSVHLLVLQTKNGTNYKNLIGSFSIKTIQSIRYEYINDQRDINRILNTKNKVNVILALPNDDIYNKETFRSILLKSYRREKIIIGFTQGMVKAGALSTIYYTPQNVAAEAERWLNEYCKHTGSMPLSRYPSEFSIVTNDHVARSMGISLPSVDHMVDIISSYPASSLRK